MDTIKKIFSNHTEALLHHRLQDQVVPFVLASASLTKQAILRALGIRFSCDAADIDEDRIQVRPPGQLVERIAIEKASVIKERHPGSLIVAADTLIFHEGKPIGKPFDIRHAHEILSLLSGSSHQALTGLAVWDPLSKQMKTCVESSVVQFHSLTDAMIEQYVKTGEPMGKAGAYALQGKGRELVKSLEGDLTNIYGLPVTALLTLLSTLDYEFIPQDI